MDFLSFKNFYQPTSIDRKRISRSIERNYKISSEISERTYNFSIKDDHTLFFSRLYDKYLKLCREQFGNFDLSDQNKTTCWCYRSSKGDSKSVWHNHFDTSVINGVYYYQVNGNDGILYWDDSYHEHKHIPEQGELIIFPHYLFHKPCVTTSNRKRYSINMEIITKQSAHELFGRLN
tara:strand:- start:140 stop:670 length:531 start_codon:yes stop_codon:yes gene_type:complete